VIEALLEEGFDSLDVTSAAIHRLIGKPADESSKAAKPAKPAKSLAATAPTAASPVAVVPPAAVAPASPRAALPSAPASAPARAPALAPKATHTASFEAHLPRKFEPRAVEPVRVDRAKHELPRAIKTTAPVPVPFVPPAVPKTSAVIPITAPASPKPRTPKPAALAASIPAPTSDTASPTDAVAIKPSLPKTPKAPPAPSIPRPNEAEAVDSKSPVVEATVGATRLWISTGEENGTTAEALRDFILGTTGEPAASLGRIDIRERHSFVDVPGDRAASFVSRLKRAEFGGKRVKAKVA
jgi:hypothetical protein